jgi:Tol biopolymer transport system component
VIPNIRITHRSGADYAISRNGVLTYVTSTGNQMGAVWVNREGKERSAGFESASFMERPTLSPNGTYIAVASRPAQEDGIQLWMYDTKQRAYSQFTFEGGLSTYEAWSPDSESLIFLSDCEGVEGTYRKRVDGVGGVGKLAIRSGQARSFSPDGKVLLLVGSTDPGGIDVFNLDSKEITRFVVGRDLENPTFSPDGKWIAYDSTETDQSEIYVKPFPETGGKWRVSRDGGSEPVWGPNGKELFYRKGDGVFAVSISTRPQFSAGTPGLLFEGPYVHGIYHVTNYSVSKDGQEFLMIRPALSRTPQEIKVVLNFSREIESKLGKTY